MGLHLFFISWAIFTVSFAVILSQKQIKSAGVLGMLLGLLGSLAILFLLALVTNIIKKSSSNDFFLVLLLVALPAYGWWFYRKKKYHAIKKPATVIKKEDLLCPDISAPPPSIQKPIILRPVKNHKKQTSDYNKSFYDQFFAECWHTINEPNQHPDHQRAVNIFFSSNKFDSGHSECLRSLQIIRDSIDIILTSKKEDTILSRMGVISMHYNGHEVSNTQEYILGLQGNQSLFKPVDYEKIHERFAVLMKEVHTVVYLNVAQGHLEKMHNVKMPKTKKKYLDLAIDALERGLTDPDADPVRIRAVLDSLKEQPKIE